VADYDKVIPPGQEGKINIKIDGKKLFPGMFEKRFTVRTNDPDNAQFVLAVMGTVKKTFEFSNDMRWSGFVDDPFKFEVDITDLLDKLQTIEKGKKYRLKLTKKKDLQPENIAANIVLTTDFPQIKEKNVMMTILIQREVELYPNRLYFGEMIIPAGATKAFDKTFNIVSARGDSLKIVKAVPNRDDMTVKIEELQPGKSYRGTVWIRPSSRLGQYAGSVKIYTNNPKQPEIILDVVGSIRVGEAVEGLPQEKK
jgi:hypothetical protein